LSEYEIIVVDNSSDKKRQQEFWKRSKDRYSEILDVESEPGLSKARNAGLRIATAPLVAFCDDDAIASENWLESLIELFEEEPRAGVAGGPVAPIWPGSAPKWLHPWLMGFFTIVDRGRLRRELSPGEWLAGTNIAFRRELLLKAGGFDERLGRRGVRLLSNEDLEIADRIRGLGFATFYEPRALVRHRIDEARVSQQWLRRRVVWQAISDALAGDGAMECDRDQCWGTIADYALRLPVEMRNLRGFFLDTEDADNLNRQCLAIGALMQLLMIDGHDPERTGGK
jgi:GT2 family glycosyltransferase